jgi:hypothetical protein
MTRIHVISESEGLYKKGKQERRISTYCEGDKGSFSEDCRGKIISEVLHFVRGI